MNNNKSVNIPALLKLLESIYHFSPGLNKSLFNWHESKNFSRFNVLAGTDNSGIVTFQGKKYYTFHDYKSNTIIIENY